MNTYEWCYDLDLHKITDRSRERRRHRSNIAFNWIFIVLFLLLQAFKEYNKIFPFSFVLNKENSNRFFFLFALLFFCWFFQLLIYTVRRQFVVHFINDEQFDGLLWILFLEQMYWDLRRRRRKSTIKYRNLSGKQLSSEPFLQWSDESPEFSTV